MVYSLLLGCIFVAIAVFFFTGKALTWISGWQTMPEAEKEKIKIVPLCRNLGAMLALAGIIFLVAGFLPGFRDNVFRWVMVGWLVLCGLDVLYIGKSKRYTTAASRQNDEK